MVNKPGTGKRLLLVLGGAHHDFEGFEARVVPLLQSHDYAVVTTYDHTCFTGLESGGYDTVLMYTSLGNAFDGTRCGHDLAPEQAKALRRWVRGGKGLVGVHSATVCRENNRDHWELLGGRFEKHPEPFAFEVYPLHSRGEFTRGIKPFRVYDEFYVQHCTDDVRVCLAALHEDEIHPMGWRRTEGQGRIACLAPGHYPDVWNNKTYQTILLRMLAWCSVRGE